VNEPSKTVIHLFIWMDMFLQKKKPNDSSRSRFGWIAPPKKPEAGEEAVANFRSEDAARKGRRRWRRRRRFHCSGLGSQVPSFWGSFSSTFPKTSTSLLAPKSPPPSLASAAVCFSFPTTFNSYIHVFLSTSNSLFAVAEGYWLKQSSISPYAGISLSSFLFRFLHWISLCFYYLVLCKQSQAVVRVSRINVPWFPFVTDTSRPAHSNKVPACVRFCSVVLFKWNHVKCSKFLWCNDFELPCWCFRIEGQPDHLLCR